MARGRPVSFDRAETLEKTLNVFWQAGYLGTSYSNLCAATGLTKPSLYGAFGNKEHTFLAALELYRERFIAPGLQLLEHEADAREAIAKLLVAIANGLTAEGTPPGCMIASNLACTGSEDIPDTISRALSDAVKETPKAILYKLSKVDAEQLPAETDSESLSLYFAAIISGLSSMAREGASRGQLIRIAETAMLCWPIQDS